MLAGPSCASACQIREFARAQGHGYPAPRPSNQRTHAGNHKRHSIQLDPKTACFVAAVSQPYTNPPRCELSVGSERKRGNPNPDLMDQEQEDQAIRPLAKRRHMTSRRSLRSQRSPYIVVYLLHGASRVVLHGSGRFRVRISTSKAHTPKIKSHQQWTVPAPRRYNRSCMSR